MKGNYLITIIPRFNIDARRKKSCHWHRHALTTNQDLEKQQPGQWRGSDFENTFHGSAGPHGLSRIEGYRNNPDRDEPYPARKARRDTGDRPAVVCIFRSGGGLLVELAGA